MKNDYFFNFVVSEETNQKDGVQDELNAIAHDVGIVQPTSAADLNGANAKFYDSYIRKLVRKMARENGYQYISIQSWKAEDTTKEGSFMRVVGAFSKI